MNTHHHKIILFIVVFLTLWGAMGYASAGTIEGTVQGLSCVLHGKVCPVDHNDPRSVDEKLFVVHLGGDDYRTVANLDRATMSNYLGRKVRIRGNFDEKYNTITVNSFAVRNEGKYEVVWSKHQEVYQDGGFFHGIGGGR